MKEVLSILGLLFIAFGIVKLAIALIRMKKENDNG